MHNSFYRAGLLVIHEDEVWDVDSTFCTEDRDYLVLTQQLKDFPAERSARKRIVAVYNTHLETYTGSIAELEAKVKAYANI